MQTKIKQRLNIGMKVLENGGSLPRCLQMSWSHQLFYRVRNSGFKTPRDSPLYYMRDLFSLYCKNGDRVMFVERYGHAQEKSWSKHLIGILSPRYHNISCSWRIHYCLRVKRVVNSVCNLHNIEYGTMASLREKGSSWFAKKVITWSYHLKDMIMSSHVCSILHWPSRMSTIHQLTGQKPCTFTIQYLSIFFPLNSYQKCV